MIPSVLATTPGVDRATVTSSAIRITDAASGQVPSLITAVAQVFVRVSYNLGGDDVPPDLLTVSCFSSLSPDPYAGAASLTVSQDHIARAHTQAFARVVESASKTAATAHVR